MTSRYFVLGASNFRSPDYERVSSRLVLSWPSAQILARLGEAMPLSSVIAGIDLRSVPGVAAGADLSGVRGGRRAWQVFG